MTPAELRARHPLATLDGLLTVMVVADMMRRGVPSVERGWVLVALRRRIGQRQRRATWADAWTEGL